VHFFKSEYEAAIEDFTAALNGNPEFFEVLLSRGVAYSCNNDPNNANDDFREVLNKKDYLNDLYNRGFEYQSKYEYVKAIAYYTALLTIKQDYKKYEVRYNRGVAYYSNGNYEAAIKDLDAVRKSSSQYSLQARGYYDLAKQNLNKSIADFNAKSIEPDMVFIKGGDFMMGSPESEPERDAAREGSQHKVTVSSFYMGKYEVTQKEFQALMGINPAHFKGDNLPVERVSWYDAIAYCNKLSIAEGLTPVYSVEGISDWAGLAYSDIPRNRNDDKWDAAIWNRKANGYRLPTEAERELPAGRGRPCRSARGTTSRPTSRTITGTRRGRTGRRRRRWGVLPRTRGACTICKAMWRSGAGTGISSRYGRSPKGPGRSGASFIGWVPRGSRRVMDRKSDAVPFGGPAQGRSVLPGGQLPGLPARAHYGHGAHRGWGFYDGEPGVGAGER